MKMTFQPKKKSRSRVHGFRKTWTETDTELQSVKKLETVL